MPECSITCTRCQIPWSTDWKVHDGANGADKLGSPEDLSPVRPEPVVQRVTRVLNGAIYNLEPGALHRSGKLHHVNTIW